MERAVQKGLCLKKKQSFAHILSAEKKNQNTHGTLLIFELHQAQFCSYVKRVAKLQNAAELSP